MHFFYRAVFKELIFSGESVRENLVPVGELGEGGMRNTQRIRKIGVFLNKKIAFR